MKRTREQIAMPAVGVCKVNPGVNYVLGIGISSYWSSHQKSLWRGVNEPVEKVCFQVLSE
jgi:hypothetical protein